MTQREKHALFWILFSLVVMTAGAPPHEPHTPLQAVLLFFGFLTGCAGLLFYAYQLWGKK